MKFRIQILTTELVPRVLPGANNGIMTELSLNRIKKAKMFHFNGRTSKWIHDFDVIYQEILNS